MTNNENITLTQRRRQGISTSQVMRVISDAISNPGATYSVLDHAVANSQGARLLLGIAERIAGRLELTGLTFHTRESYLFVKCDDQSIYTTTDGRQFKEIL